MFDMTHIITTEVLMAVSGGLGWYIGRKGLQQTVTNLKAELEYIKSKFVQVTPNKETVLPAGTTVVVPLADAPIIPKVV